MLIGNFHARFPEDMPSVLGLFSILNVANFTSSSDSEEFKVYGDESIRIKKKKKKIISEVVKILLGINGVIFTLKWY